LIFVFLSDLSLNVAIAQKPDGKPTILAPIEKTSLASSWTIEPVTSTGEPVLDVLRIKEVQVELNCDREQQVDIADRFRDIDESLAEWKKLNHLTRDERTHLFQSKRREVAERIAKLTKCFVAEIEDVLNPNQVDRLLAIFCQIHGAIAVTHPIVEKRLGISINQRTRIHGIVRNFKLGDEGIEDLILNVLTDDQKRELVSMKGKSFELETNPLTGFRRTKR